MRIWAARCAAALVDPLGWLDHPGQATPARDRPARRRPTRAPDLAQLDAVNTAPGLLEAVGGLRLARGSAVIDAIRAGEECAAAALAEAR